LPSWVTASGIEIGFESAPLKQVGDKVLGAFGAYHHWGIFPIPHPSGDHKQGEITNVVMVQMRSKNGTDVGWAHIGSHHIPGDTSTAIKEIVAAIIQSHQDPRLRSVGIHKCSASSQHGNSHFYSLRPK
jgi:hypothetical protein